MIVVNFFGGPESGKSVAASCAFSNLKILGHSCQYVQEYAKQCVYQKRFDILKQDQLYILAKQNHRLKILQIGKEVQFAVVDSPLILSNIYIEFYGNKISDSFKNLTLECFNQYNNINFFIKRTHKYESQGRIQKENQAIELDNAILKHLNDNKINFEFLQSNNNIFQQIKKSRQLANNNLTF